MLLSKAKELGAQYDPAKFFYDFETDLIPPFKATSPTPECSKNADGIRNFASEPCTRGFRNLKCWDVGSSESLVPVFSAGVASSHKNFALEFSWFVCADQQPSGRLKQPHEQKINPEKVLLPPLHIKLGIMKQFVKALDKNGTCFQYLCTQFPLLSDAKLKEGIFVGPDIQKLIKDKMFSSTVTQVEKEAWVAFTNVVLGFLGKKKDPEYGRLVNVMLEIFEKHASEQQPMKFYCKKVGGVRGEIGSTPLYTIYLPNSEALVVKSGNVFVQNSLLISTDVKNAGNTLPMDEPLLTDIFKNVSKILLKEESLLELELPLVICGDIHGNFCQLLRIFNRIGWPPKVRYLFLGDYIDRGYRNLEVIALLFTLKILYPEAVFLLRGNHEALPVNRNYGFKREVRNRGFSTLFWLTAQITFNCLPLAAVIASKIFCAHGGISPFLKDFDQIRNFQRPLNVPSDGLITDLLWADPIMQFCKDFSIDLIIRAHECVEEGFAYFADGKLITIFSCPNYNGNNNGAALTIDEECKIEITTFCSISSSSNVENEEYLNAEDEKKH
ncbi:Serine/threonine-protein phosphatase PP1 isozyme 1 [Trichinella sp. T8]|nr:Serine/threonine-protein phosphatase PP1 isozyme 1 [Trichinella sp. T8]